MNFRETDEGEQLNVYLESRDAKKFDQELFETSKNNNGFWMELMPLSIEGKSKKRFLPTCKRQVGSWKRQKDYDLLPLI